MESPVEIHPARLEELPAVSRVHQQAFGGRSNEARLVELLHARGQAPISLVAAQAGQVVGHVLFSPVWLEPPAPGLDALGLAPIGVLPAYQRQGLGSRLIQAGLQACRETGCAAVVVLGDPAYYRRFGFVPARDYGLGSDYGAGEEFRVVELRPDALAGIHGTVKYQPEFAETGC